MKTFTLFLLLFAIATAAFSQIQKGQYLLGGGINFESAKEAYPINRSHKSNDFFISPSIGYFIIDKFGGGLRIDMSFYNSKGDNVETHSTITGISPFVRYYFLPVPKNVNAFIDVGYVHSKTKWNSFSNPAYSEKSKGFKISAGPSIFLTDQIALEFILGFRHTTSDDFGPGLEPAKSSIFNSGLGLQVHLGKIKNKSDN